MAAFDAWAATFGNVVTAMEYTVTGEYKPVSRFAEFVNLPELTQLARTVFDVKRAADIPDFKRPKRDDAVDAVPMSDGQRAYMADIQRRAEAAKKKRPGEPGDNMLSISTDARKSAIDLRMVDPHAEFDPAGKVAAVVRNVLRLHRENPGATQMIFSDIGVNPTPWGFSLYQDVIDRLVAGGIPRDKIINFGALTDAAKKNAAKDLNDGKALVAIGSTDKLGTGVNAQQYLKALHHLDVPWLPGSLEQRDGRAWRQKNTHERISIHRYVTEGSFDTFMWQTVDKKTRFIRQATDGKDVGRVVKDEDAEELTPAQVMAIASGNPLLLEKVQVDKDFTDLQAAARRHERNELQMRDRAAEIERQIKRRTTEVEAVEKDLALARASADADFSIEIDGKTYTDREKASEAIEVFKAEHYTARAPVAMGRLRGFDLLFGRATQGGEIYVRGAFESMGTPTLPSVEVRTRPAFFENAATRGREMLGNLTKDLATLRGQMGRPFTRAAELERVGQRRAEIETRLVAQGQQQAAVSTPDAGYNSTREASDGPTAQQRPADIIAGDATAEPGSRRLSPKTGREDSGAAGVSARADVPTAADQVAAAPAPITGARVKARGDEIVQEAKDAGAPISLAAARKQAFQEIQDQSSRNPMRPRGAVDIGALEAPVKAATLPLKGAKKLFDAWSRPLIDTVESQGGAVGKRIAQGMRRANDDARDIVGSMHPTLNRYSDAVSGAPGRNFLARRRAVQELQEPILSDGYGYSRLQLATEGKIPLDDLSPEARQIVQLRRDLTAEIGQHAVKRGVMVVDEKMARADRKAARQASAAAKAAKKAWQKARARRRKNDPDVEADGAQWRGLRDTFGKDHPAVALARRQWRQRWAERVDNDPAVRDAFAAWQERRDAARLAREKVAAKGVRPFIPAKDGMRWVRSYSPEFYEIADLADDNGLKMALANAIADANGIEARVAMRHVNETARPLVKHNATETVRLLKDFPAWVQHPTTGRWIEVLNIDPLTSGRALVDNAALRLGYISVFGQDIAGRTPSAALVDAFSKAGGNRKDLERAIRAMNGVPEDRIKLPGNMHIEPGTAEHDAVRAVGSVYHVLKSGALTTAAVPNALEPFTKTLAFAGVGPWLRGLAAVARHPFASREMTAAIGARTVDRMRWMTRPRHRAEDVMQAIGNVLTAPLKFVNEWNELHAARTGMELSKDIRAGKHKGAAAVTLEVLGFSPSQVERMVSGRGSDAEYGAIATRFAEKTQGTTSNPAEKSMAANSRLWRLAVPFDSWAQMTANRTALVVTTWGRAVRSGDPSRIAQATKLLATHFFGHAAAGAGAAFLYAWLNGGEAGVEIKRAEAKDDPVQFAKDALLNGMLGGVAGRLYRAIESPRSTSLIEIPQSASYPATLLQDAVEAFNGWGRYRDQEAGDRATAFLRNRFAINRGVANLMAAWGITADDPAREVAVSAFYRWRREQADLPQQRGGERLTAENRVPFRRKMRQTLEAMKRLDEPAAQKALAEALNLDDEKSVAASIRGRKLMTGLTDDHKARLRKRIGDAAYAKLESHDDLLEAWAQSLRFETETNRGVHARHGDKLLAFDKERDAVEKAYEPIRKQLTGLWMEDVGLLNANADLIDRGKELAAKARELEKIRKSLRKHPKTPFTHLGMTDAELNKEMDRVLSE